MEYYLIRSEVHDEYCALRKIPDELKRKSYKFAKGLKMGGDFPKGVAYYMDEEHPGMKFADLIYTPSTNLMASKRFQELMQNEGIENIEYLNFHIFNHKKRLASSEYCIINLLGTQDCLNLEKSIFKRSNIDPNSISGFEKMVLDPDKIPEEKKLFRIKEAPKIFIANQILVDRIMKEGLTGVKLTKVECISGS